jgi:hypothetical protein
MRWVVEHGGLDFKVGYSRIRPWACHVESPVALISAIRAMAGLDRKTHADARMVTP